MARFILNFELEHGCFDCKCHDHFLDKCRIVPWLVEKEDGRQINCPLTPFTQSNLYDQHFLDMLAKECSCQ